MEQPAIVSIKNLSHKYQVHWAVKNINLRFEKRGIYGLLGSNGAGKSTIMNIMCGVLKPTAGEISIKGIDLAKKPLAARRHLGFLPQRPPLYNYLTVEEYLRYCGALRWLSPKVIKQAVNEVMDRCSLTHYRKRLIAGLSGGYQQRVGIAQAIIHKPELVVFDEPTNGLDPTQIVTIRNLIKDIAEERTVILSTHILSEVQASCRFICMIEQGNIAFNGSIEAFENYLAPSTVFVSFANPPVNNLLLLNGTVKVETLDTGNYRIHFAGEGTTFVDRLVTTSVQQGWLLREVRIEKNTADEIFSAIANRHQIK
jgi:ABC-2 type transport system ATP-binding protein